jgi:hypothetical protein
MIQTYSHSADVHAWLDCGEHGCIPLVRITRKSVVARQVYNIPPCHARLVVKIDGRQVSNEVSITNGFNGRRTALIRPAGVRSGSDRVFAASGI